MKNKKSAIYILMILCIVVWGTIGWKVYAAFRKESPTLSVVPRKVVVEKKDTAMLLLNYRDPFLGGYPKAEKAVKDTENTKYPVKKEIYTPPSTEVIPDFQYKGVIRVGKKTQAIIEQDGQSRIFSVRERINDFTILRITDESLTVSRKNKTYELSLQ